MNSCNDALAETWFQVRATLYTKKFEMQFLGKFCMVM